MGRAGAREFTAMPDSAGFSAAGKIRFTVPFRETITMGARRSIADAAECPWSRDRGRCAARDARACRAKRFTRWRHVGVLEFRLPGTMCRLWERGRRRTRQDQISLGA